MSVSVFFRRFPWPDCRLLSSENLYTNSFQDFGGDSDKHTVFRINRSNAPGGTGMTQFGRALAELNIEIICANSSQAKGRVERVNRTLQDHLVKELRLANISKHGRW